MQQDQAAPEAQAHRQRLLEGMAKSVGMKGYAASTVADIVAEAGCHGALFMSTLTAVLTA